MDTIVIVSFGSQADLLAERVRQEHVYTEVVHFTRQPKTPVRQIKGYILSSGPGSITSDSAREDLPNYVLESGVPVLGIGYGMHALVRRLGGQVVSGQEQWTAGKETLLMRTWSGYHFFNVAPLREARTEYFSHCDSVTVLPKGFDSVAETRNFAHAVIADLTRDYYGFQFHPELSEFDYLKTFATTICNCKTTWTMEKYLKDAINELRISLLGEKVYIPLTANLDCLVGAALLNKALGEDKIVCSMVVSPLLRVGERDAVLDACSWTVKLLPVEMKSIQQALPEDPTPEQVFDTVRDIYGTAHLNDATLASDMYILTTNVLGKSLVGPGRSVNPLQNLYRSEVRELGKELGLPAALLERPFLPLCGLAHRCCTLEGDAVEILRSADYITQCHLAKLPQTEQKLYARVLLEKCGGQYVALVHIMQRLDRVRKRYAEVPHSFLTQLSKSLRDTGRISRVYYDITDTL